MNRRSLPLQASLFLLFSGTLAAQTAVSDGPGKPFRYLGPDGKPAFAGTFRQADDFREGFGHAQRSDGVTVWLRPDGSPAFRSDVPFERTGSVSDGLAWFVRDGLTGYLDTKGKEVLAPQWRPLSLEDDPTARDFSGGRAAAATPARWAWIGRDGKLTESPGPARPFREGRAFRWADGRYRLIDEMFKVVGKASWDDAAPFSEGLAAVTDGGRAFWIDKTGAPAFAGDFDRTSGFSGGYAVFDRGDRQGVVDRSGQVVIPAQDYLELVPVYEATYSFRLWKFRLVPAGPWGLVDATGREVSEPWWEEITPYSDGLAAVRREGRWGWLDSGGAAVLPVTFAGAGDFREGLAPAAIGSRWGFVDRKGLLVTDLAWDSAGPFEGGLAPVSREGLWGLVDRSGTVVVEPELEALGALKDDRRPFRKDGLWGYLDREGRVALAPAYRSASPFSGGLAWVTGSGGSGLITPEGASVGPRDWQAAEPAEGGLPFRVVRPSLVGVIDKKGAWVQTPAWASLTPGRPGPDLVQVDEASPPAYLAAGGAPVALPEGWEPAGAFRENRAFVRRWTETGAEFGLVDPAGTLVASGWSEVGEGFAGGAAAVRTTQGWGLIDQDGKAAGGGNWAEALGPDEGLFRYRDQDKWGYADLKGRIVLPAKYEAAGPFRGGLAEVVQAGKPQRISRP